MCTEMENNTNARKVEVEDTEPSHRTVLHTVVVVEEEDMESLHVVVVVVVLDAHKDRNRIRSVGLVHIVRVIFVVVVVQLEVFPCIEVSSIWILNLSVVVVSPLSYFAPPPPHRSTRLFSSVQEQSSIFFVRHFVDSFYHHSEQSPRPCSPSHYRHHLLQQHSSLHVLLLHSPRAPPWPVVV